MTDQVALNDAQATDILQKAINAGSSEGGLPTDEATRIQYAVQFAAQCKTAFDAGNREQKVIDTLVAAGIPMEPPAGTAAPMPPAAVAPPPAAAPPVAAPPVAAAPAPVAAPAAAQGSFDFTTLSDESLAKMIKTLQAPEYAAQPNVTAEIAQLEAEQTRRAGGTPDAQAPQPQAVAPQPEAPTPAAPPVATAPAPVAASAPVPVPAAAPVAQPVALAEPPAAGAVVPTGFPAPPAPGDAAPPSVNQAGAPVDEALQPAQEDAERAGLEAQLTYAIMGAYGVDPAQVPTLSLDTLRMMVANPAGPVANDTTATPTDVAAPTNDAREGLLAQITGGVLKAFGRGRKDLLDIGDHELMMMVEHPDGQVTLEQLQVARGADGSTSDQLPPALKGAAPAPPVAVPPPGTPGAPVAVAQAPAPVSAFAPPVAAPEQPPVAPAPVAPVPVAAPPTMLPPAVEAPAPALAQVPNPQPVPLTPPVGAPPVTTSEATARAMAIISAENMPIPPEIDGDPPRLPNDLSKESDAALHSFHARFHACEVRMNWVISQFDDEIGDVRKLLRNKRREVGLAIPATHEGKKVTKDIKEALVDADAEVQQHLHNLSEIEATVGKLKVLRDGYHQDVSTCSRQWSMRSGEADKLPR